jgi:hypothetical protein
MRIIITLLIALATFQQPATPKQPRVIALTPEESNALNVRVLRRDLASSEVERYVLELRDKRRAPSDQFDLIVEGGVFGFKEKEPVKP